MKGFGIVLKILNSKSNFQNVKQKLTHYYGYTTVTNFQNVNEFMYKNKKVYFFQFQNLLKILSKKNVDKPMWICKQTVPI